MSSSDSQIDNLMESFVEDCRQRGLKATHQRMEVYREVIRSEEHPDAETVFQRVQRRIPSISRNTVYSTLQLLVDYGFIGTMGSHFDRRRFDGNTEPHYHCICTQCGAVEDFRMPETIGPPPSPKVKKWGAIDSAYLEFRGTCSECLRKNSET